MRVDADPALLEAVVNEIELMRQLKERGLTNQIIELIDAEVKHDEQIIHVVMECGEIDLAHLLMQRQRDSQLSECFVCMCGAAASYSSCFVLHSR